jgi:RNA polymerase sigma-70 factor (ECF subfamily)
MEVLLNYPTPSNKDSTDLLEQAFDNYYNSLFRFFCYRGMDIHTANDLAASVFENALKNLHCYDPQKAQIQTWLFAIARNLSINYWRSEKEPPIPLEDELPQSNPELEDLVINEENKVRILLALNMLDTRSREILALKFSGGLTNREIASLTGHTESNIGVILYRSLQKLRVLLSSPQLEVRNDR